MKAVKEELRTKIEELNTELETANGKIVSMETAVGEFEALQASFTELSQEHEATVADLQQSREEGEGLQAQLTRKGSDMRMLE